MVSSTLDLATHNAIDTMTKCGWIAGKNAIFLDQFTISFGISLFTNKQIPERINYLIKHSHSINDEIVAIIPIVQGLEVTDLSGSFRNLKVAVLVETENDDVYSIRPFHKQSSEVIGKTKTISRVNYHNVVPLMNRFWNFTYHNKKIKACKPEDAFLDVYKTRAVTNMLVIGANLMGFESTSY